MKKADFLSLVTDSPKLIATQVVKPLRVAVRKQQAHPNTQQKLADMVNDALVHEIRAGFTHRFIPLLFVTVGSRVFCRRYTYSEPSWHSAFVLGSPQGQIKLDKTVVNIEAHVPYDMEDVLSQVDNAYAKKLRQLGARFMLAGATEQRAQESTIEIMLSVSTDR